MKSKVTSIEMVKPISVKLKTKLILECGKKFKGFQMIFETYGDLNEERSNAILVCHALSGNHHAAGFHETSDKKTGWWVE